MRNLIFALEIRHVAVVRMKLAYDSGAGVLRETHCEEDHTVRLVKTH